MSKHSLLQYIATTLLTFILSITSFAKESAWKDTEINLTNYKNFINEQTCGTSQQAYLGCVSSVQTLLRLIDPKLSIETQTTAEDAGGKIALDANNLKVVRTTTAKAESTTATTAKDIYASLEKKKSDFLNKFSPAYYHYKATNDLVTKKIVDHIVSKYASQVKPDNIAEALNEYFHVAADPHSDFRLNKDIEEGQKSASTSFVGLGITFKPTAGGVFVEHVFEGSAAEISGIEVGDLIISVDKKSLLGLTSEEARSLLLGEEGSQINLTWIHDSNSITKVVTRKKVTQKVVDSKILNLFNQKTGYIKYTNFMYENSCKEISNALIEFNNSNVNGAILDLRHNGGGRIDIANCIVGLFIGPDLPITFLETNSATNIKINEMINQAFNKGSPRIINHPQTQLEPIVTANEQIFKKPLTIIINAYSASASELISGALREYNRALIVGQTSFGKGSSQGPILITKDISFWATNGLFFQPSGKTNQTIGIVPHLQVYTSPTPKDEEVFAIRERDNFLFPLQTRKLNVPYPTDMLDQIKVSDACLGSKNVVQTYNELPKSNRNKDLQLLTAAAAIGCYE